MTTSYGQHVNTAGLRSGDVEPACSPADQECSGVTSAVLIKSKFQVYFAKPVAAIASRQRRDP